MKILFLHLSDLHIQDNTLSINATIPYIVNSLKELPKFDEATIILSGDIVFSGQKHEYKHAKHFIGRLIYNIRKEFWNNEYKKIEVIVVPGNHDISFPSKQRNRNEARKLSKDFNNTINEEIKLQRNFFEFANFNGCFINNKIVDTKNVNYGNYEIQFNLINSALYSILNDENNDSDKDIHILPCEYLNLIKKTNSTSMTVMHHNTDWFDWESKKNLEEIISKNSSILFVGHEHVPQMAFRTINGNYDCLFSKGGTFNEPSLSDNFITILYDTNNQEFKTFSMELGNEVFNVTQIDRKVLNVPLRYKDFILTKAFLSKLDETLWGEINPNAIFEFPYLRKSKEDEFNDNKQITDYEDFVENMNNKDFCLLEGNELSGKSFLLKFLYKNSFSNAVPLFIDANDVIKNEKIENLIKRNFEQQYGDDKSLYSKYCQLNKEEKFIFVDNLDKIQKQQDFILKLKEKYGLIYATSKPTQYNIRDLILAKTNENKDIVEFIIEPFYYEKRIKLIKKICKSLYGDDNSILIDKKVKDINDFICENLKLFNISPYFILSFCIAYIKRPSGSGTKLNVFGEVFRSNIVQNYSKSTNIKVDTAFFILEEIALRVFREKKYPIPTQMLIEIIDEYNKEYDQKINSLDFIKALEDSKIFKPVNESQSYKFTSENILAFFIAKKIIDMKDQPNVKTFLCHLVTYISFGINSEILMFVISLRNDWDLLNYILKEVVVQTQDWKEFSFAQNNLSFLNNNIKETILKIPTEQNKKIVIKNKENDEKIIKNEQLNTIDIFDYNENDLEKFINLQTRALKDLTLVSSLFANFYYMIPANNKNDFLDYIFKQPNKIIYYMLSPFDDNFNKSIDVLYNEISETNNNLQKSDLVDMFVKISEIIILNVYCHSSQFVGTDETIDRLIKYVDESKSINNEIQLILTLESMERLKQFGERAENLERNTSLAIVGDMVKRMVYHYFLWNNVSLKGYGQHLASKYLKNDKKLLKQVQNRSLRKKK